MNTFYHGYSKKDRETLALAELEKLIEFSSEPRTLAEIGTRLGLTRERIRQIEAAALKKLATFAKRRFTEEERLEFFAMLANRGTMEPLSPTAPALLKPLVKGNCACGKKLKVSITGRCKTCNAQHVRNMRFKKETAKNEGL